MATTIAPVSCCDVCGATIEQTELRVRSDTIGIRVLICRECFGAPHADTGPDFDDLPEAGR